MADVPITLRAGEASPSDIKLYSLPPVAGVVLSTLVLYSRHVTDPRNIVLRPTEVLGLGATTPPLPAPTLVPIWLYQGRVATTDVTLRDPTAIDGYTPPAFPTQFAGLRTYYGGGVKELCLVAVADAPTGNQWRVRKGSTTYAVYLVATGDAQASSVRVQTSSGTMAARLKT